MRTTVDIDPALLEQLRLESVRRGVSVKSLLNTVIRAGLAARIGESLAAYRVDSVSLGAPRADITKALTLVDMLEDEEHRRDLQLRK